MNAFGHDDRGQSRPPTEDEREEAAGMWLARRDRGLTEQEEAEFSAWFAADSRNHAVLEELEGPFHALDRASGLRPANTVEPDPNLLLSGKTTDRPEATASITSRRKEKSRIVRFPVWATLGAAAAVAIGMFVLRRVDAPIPMTAARSVVVRQGPERMSLPDGSVIELKAGARVEVAFTPEERRVQMTAGEAHFIVAKGHALPFLVVAGDVAVRAVGTAFSVNRAKAEIEVVVSEGRVRVDDTQGRSLLAGDAASPRSSAPLSETPLEIEPTLDAGHRVVIPLAAGEPSPAPMVLVPPDEMERVLAWRSPWLEFVEVPLAELVVEFNGHSGGAGNAKLKIADEVTGRVLVSGMFRANGVDAFVRLLGSSFGVDATLEADGDLLLRKAR